jgi:HTH-type transcriptional regulator/antitoxin HipB
MALKDKRKTLELTQKEAGRKIGLLPKTISALETHPERCTLESLFKLISALDLEIELHEKSQEQKGEW